MREGLVGQIKDLEAGDKVRIWNESQQTSEDQYEVVGYVIRYGKTTITMSMEHPIKRPIGSAYDRILSAMFGTQPSFQQTTYNLAFFSNYAKLQDIEKEPEDQSELEQDLS